MLKSINEIMAVLECYDIDVVMIDGKKSNICIKAKDGSIYDYDILFIVSKTKLMLEANKQGIYCILN